MITSGDGLIYNVARSHMLTSTFRWTDRDKFAVLADTDYNYNEQHKTFYDVGASAPALEYGSNVVPGLFVSVNAWAGSDPIQFSGENWTKPVGSLLIARYTGVVGSVADANNGAKYELIACLTVFLGGPIYPDGSPFSLTFDQSGGQQGWFRP
jgi:hypothetical protein